MDGLIHRNGLNAHQIAKVTDIPGAGQAELLIEITVIEMALPIHTDQLTAHHGAQISWVVCVLQKGLVTPQIAAAFQLLSKTLDGHVCQRQETIEPNPQPGQGFLVIGLQGLLGGRQDWSQRVVDEIQLPVRIARSVAQGIELAQPADAAFEHAIPSLTIHIFSAVTGQGCGDTYALLRQKFSQVLLTGFTEDREIATVNHGSIA